MAFRTSDHNKANRFGNADRVDDIDGCSNAGHLNNTGRFGDAEHFDNLINTLCAARNCPLAYEPSGEDFLSPCLAEADFMRRVLDRRDFSKWLTSFLPTVPVNGSAQWLQPGIVTDRADPKLAHIDGLNLSRAWMLDGIAHGLGPDDPRVGSLLAAAKRHRDAALPAVTGEHYEGGHWLGTFAVYLTSEAGL